MSRLLDKLGKLNKALKQIKLKKPKIKGPKPPKDLLPKPPKIKEIGQVNSPTQVIKPPKLPGIANQDKKDPIKVAAQLKVGNAPVKPLLKTESEDRPSYQHYQERPIKYDLPHIPGHKVNLVSADYNGFAKDFNNTHEQRKLIHGLDISTIEPLEASTNTLDSGWAKNSITGEDVFVKPASGALEGNMTAQDRAHHLTPSGFNSTAREVMFHNMARDFFGLGEYVPQAAAFTHRGKDYSAHKKVEGSAPAAIVRSTPSNPLRPHLIKTLHTLSESGDLHKMAMMDFVMSNRDRHGSNYLLDHNKPTIHLIDHGLSFDMSNLLQTSTNVPHYINLANTYMGPQKIHPDAAQWLEKLDHMKALDVFKKHGYSIDDDHVSHFMGRLNKLKDHVKENPHAYIAEALDDAEGPSFKRVPPHGGDNGPTEPV